MTSSVQQRQRRSTRELDDQIRTTLKTFQNERPLTAKDIADLNNLDFRVYASAVHATLKLFAAGGFVKVLDPGKTRNQHFVWVGREDNDAVDTDTLAKLLAPIDTSLSSLGYDAIPPMPPFTPPRAAKVPEPPEYSEFKAVMIETAPDVVRAARCEFIDVRAWQEAVAAALGVKCPAATLWSDKRWLKQWRLSINKLRQYGYLERGSTPPSQVRVNLRIALLEFEKWRARDQVLEYAQHVENEVSALVRLQKSLDDSADGGLLKFARRK